jgi:UDPglucose 6-dehydrogenase
LFTNPEFLRQGTALADVAAPTRIVIGRFPDADADALRCVVGLYDRLVVPVLVVDVEAAELIKNGANAFLALKLSFTNEMAALAEEYGTDIDEVLQGMGLDPRIGFDYMRPSYGFGGSCLPKELQALAVAGQDRALPMHVTIAAAAANGAQQARFADRIARIMGGVAGRSVGVLGLAFKAGTDDVRESPALALVARLLADGADVRAYDPEAAANAALQLPGLTTLATPEEAVRGADAVVIATEWPAFRDLDWAGLRPTMRAPLVVDGRRLLDGESMRSLGYRYVAVGTASEESSPVTS